MIYLVLASLGGLTGWFGTIYGKDLIKNKNNFEEHTSWKVVVPVGTITNFFDTLGIGSFAPLTALLKFFNQLNDRIIPGTLNVSCTLPIVLQAFVFMSVIEVEIITLISMLFAATVGAYLGAGIVAHMDERKIQGIMGVALIITAFLMLAGQMNWMPLGGEAIALRGTKLFIAIVGNFILGSLMTVGVGLYAPCMALVYMLGLSPKVAFPIMMGSCAFLMPVASVKFIKEKAYNRKAAIGITAGGIVGVLVAAFIVKSLPINILTWVVIGVVTITGISMIRSAIMNNDVDETSQCQSTIA